MYASGAEDHDFGSRRQIQNNFPKSVTNLAPSSVQLIRGKMDRLFRRTVACEGVNLMGYILLTGGTGCLGWNWFSLLLTSGHRARVMSRRAAIRAKQRTWNEPKSFPVWISSCMPPVTPSNIMSTSRAPSCCCSKRKQSESKISYTSPSCHRRDCLFLLSKQAGGRTVDNGLGPTPDSGLPRTIQRATQVHSFIDRLLRLMTRLPIAFVPAN